MTAPRSPRVMIPEERLHGTGPWLVVHVHGDGPARRAVKVQQECERHGVMTRLLPLDEAHGLDHAKYRALVVIGGDPDTMTTATMSAIRELICDYRARWSRDLDDLRSGRGDFVDSGVVQLLLDDQIDAPGALETIACVVHHVADTDTDTDTGADDGTAVLFDAYKGAVERSADAAGGGFSGVADDRGAQRVWKRLEEWGLRDYAEVETILVIIEECREKYESPRYTALRRPIDGRDCNRLDFVLDDRFHDGPPGPGQDTWRRDGQRVVRETTAAITAELPHVGNPRRHRGALESFQNFYRNLQLMRTYLHLSR